MIFARDKYIITYIFLVCETRNRIIKFHNVTRSIQAWYSVVHN